MNNFKKELASKNNRNSFKKKKKHESKNKNINIFKKKN
jgi:hypothetical protein